MSHFNIKLWEKFKSNVIDHQQNLDRKVLIDLLLSFSKDLKPTKDVTNKQLYNRYLAYFEDMDIPSYYKCDEVWYSLENLVTYDILNSNVDNYKRPVVNVRDLLWELLAFKSDRECPSCGDDDMRVLSPKNSSQLILACDLCTYACDLEGNEAFPEEKCYPTHYDLIKAAGIRPGKP
jgi:hypothetical protein